MIFIPLAIAGYVASLQSASSDVWIANNVLLHAGRRVELREHTPGPWVQAWGGFALARNGRIAALYPDGRISNPKSKIGLSPDPLNGDWAVSPDGKKVVEFPVAFDGEARLVVTDLATGRRLVDLDQPTLTRRLGKAKAAPAYAGVLWSPDSTRIAFAHGFGCGLDNGGAAYNRITELDLRTKSMRRWASKEPERHLGKPFAWLNDDTLLVEAPSGVYRLGRTRSVARLSDQGQGLKTAWNGTHVLIFRSRGSDHKVRLERWLPDLKRRVSACDVPGLKWTDVNNGVYSAMRGQGKKRARPAKKVSKA